MQDDKKALTVNICIQYLPWNQSTYESLIKQISNYNIRRNLNQRTENLDCQPGRNVYNLNVLKLTGISQKTADSWIYALDEHAATSIVTQEQN